MKTLTILKYQWKDLLRGKWMIGYGLIYLLFTDVLIRFGGSGPKVLLSISNIILLFIPLISMIYGVLFLYQSREFTELLLAQPLERKELFWGLFGGLVLPLSLAFVAGVGLPLLYTGLLIGSDGAGAMLLIGLGIALTVLFTGLGFMLGLRFFDDRIKGFGFALAGWLLLAVLYDALILTAVFILEDYPLEKPMLILTLLNPVDLARIVVLLKFEISALMSYTGAVFSRLFGSVTGISVAASCLMLWITVPIWRSVQLFKKRDF